jgi:hypothetical protein
MENLDDFALRRPFGTLQVCMPLPAETKLQWIATSDVASFVQMAFDHPRRFGDRPVELAADELTLWGATTLIASHRHETVGYVRVNMRTIAKLSGHLLGMYRWFEVHTTYHADIPRLRAMHPRLLTFSQWLERNGPPREDGRVEARPAA